MAFFSLSVALSDTGSRAEYSVTCSIRLEHFWLQLLLPLPDIVLSGVFQLKLWVKKVNEAQSDVIM